VTRKLPRLLRIPWRAARVDVDDELRFHVDMAAADLVARGVSPDVARAEAERRFGVMAEIRDEVLTIDERRRRHLATADHMSAFLQDFAHAFRSLRKTPMLTLIGSLTIMIGVGSTTAIFSVVNGVLLRPLPYPTADRLVLLFDNQPQSGETPFQFSELARWKKDGGSIFEDIGGWFGSSLTLTGVEQPVVLRGLRVTSSLPRVLGVRPVLGRSFGPEHDGGDGQRAVMLSSDFWRRQFNGDSTIIGRTLQLSGNPFTVIGVFPSGLESRVPTQLASSRAPDYWQGLRLDEPRAPAGLHFISLVGLLRRDVSFAAATSRITFLNRQFASDTGSVHRVAAADLSARVLGPSRAMLGAIFGAVVLVLLVACANVANLLLTRAAARQREIAIRTALGASRSRIISQLLVESTLRALIGGALGVAFAMLCLHYVRQSRGVQLPRLTEVGIDGLALSFALGVSLLTGIAFGLVPALRSANADANTVIREGGRGISGSLRRDFFRRALIIGELVTSVVLLCGAGLLLRSFQQLLNVPLGFEAERVITASVNLPVATKYRDSLSQIGFFDQVLSKVRAIPGVESVAASSNLPVEGGADGGVPIEGKTYPVGGAPVADKRWVTAGYFHTLGARIVKGREFLASDAMTSQHVAIVNEAFASRYLPNESPIGKRIDFGWNTSGFQTIVGVVANVREGSLSGELKPAVYVPHAQRSSGFMYLIARTSIDETSVVPAIRRVVKEVDSQIPVEDVRPLEEVATAGIATQRFTAFLLQAFAFAALLLAAIGLYGVVSYSVAQRTQELGVRAALGAQRGELLAGVMREGMAFVAIGVVVGLVAARGAAQFISAQLFGVTPGDPTVYLVVPVLLGVVSAVALMAPAMRAAAIDPIIALREE
jgi:putative ABC transport system permease protein